MPVGKSLIAATTGTAVAVALFFGINALRARLNPPAPPAMTVDVRAISGSRFFYPATGLPALVLPGGRIETIRSVLNVKGRMRYGDSIWNEDNVPAGPIWVRVDLSRQLLSVFRAGHEIGTAVILYGASDKESPAGAFPVLQKAEDYHSRTYDAPMPYMLRLTADGVAIHGADVRQGAATHGCIGVPTDFARRLFAQVKLGDPVVIVKPPAKT